MFEAMKKSFDKGVAKVSIKSNEFIEVTKLRTMNSNLEKEILNDKGQLGALVYRQWQENASNSADINEICLSIKDKEKSIVENNEKIEALQRENEQILHTSGKRICSCGYANSDTVKFCVNCGKAFVEPVTSPEVNGQVQQTSNKSICSCGYANNENAKFCLNCGSPLIETVAPVEEVLTKTCKCGNTVDINLKFCPKCGSKFEEQSDLNMDNNNAVEDVQEQVEASNEESEDK